MDDKGPEPKKAPLSLTAALRSARIDVAERSQAVAGLRSAEVGRLDLLREALEPVLAEIPDEIDLFDTGIVPGEHPRLFVDMIAFVDMDRDRRTYRFHLDTRHGRKLLAETDNVQVMTAKVTDYIARRLVERETALTSLAPDMVTQLKTGPETRVDVARPPRAPAPPPPPPRSAGVLRGLRLGIDGLGVAALAGLVWLGLHFVGGRFLAW